MPFDGKSADYKTNTTADVLRRARALIDSPEKWCKDKLSDGAHSYCVRGALIKAIAGSVDEFLDDVHIRSLQSAERALGFPGYDGKHGEPLLPEWNNARDRNHPEIMAAFDKAIALAESEG